MYLELIELVLSLVRLNIIVKELAHGRDDGHGKGGKLQSLKD